MLVVSTPSRNSISTILTALLLLVSTSWATVVAGSSPTVEESLRGLKPKSTKSPATSTKAPVVTATSTKSSKSAGTSLAPTGSPSLSVSPSGTPSLSLSPSVSSAPSLSQNPSSQPVALSFLETPGICSEASGKYFTCGDTAPSSQIASCFMVSDFGVATPFTISSVTVWFSIPPSVNENFEIEIWTYTGSEPLSLFASESQSTSTLTGWPSVITLNTPVTFNDDGVCIGLNFSSKALAYFGEPIAGGASDFFYDCEEKDGAWVGGSTVRPCMEVSVS